MTDHLAVLEDIADRMGSQLTASRSAFDWKIIKHYHDQLTAAITLMRGQSEDRSDSE